jgi:flagellar biosynthetic protein FliP
MTFLVGVGLAGPLPAAPQTEAQGDPEAVVAELLEPAGLAEPNRLAGTLRTVALVAVASLAPAIALMTTSFVRIAIVLGILRHAIGAQQIPSTQIVMALSLFMTLLVMAPVWNEVRTEAIDPYVAGDQGMTLEEAWQRGTRPVRRFMSRQIQMAGNIDDIWLFHAYLPEAERAAPPETFDDVPMQVMLPAFMISELKVAFLIGFQIFMPFLVLDLVVTAITTSMGMVMLPPVTISLPLKLALFVLADGWNLVVGMLMESFAPYW